MPPQPSLGEFEQIVLLAILRLGDHAYGVTILAEIAAHTGRNPSPGALYTTLHRMEDKGLITFRDGSPTPERGGRAKRFVTVSGPGRDALARAQTAYRSLLEGLDLLTPPIANLTLLFSASSQTRVPPVSPLRHGNRATSARVPHPSQLYRDGWDAICRAVRPSHFSPLKPGNHRVPPVSPLRPGYGATYA